MKATIQDLVNARLKKAKEAREMARLAAEAGFWNSAASELYYVCFHSIQALFSGFDVTAHTHAGLKSLFSLKFIKEKLVDERWAKLLGKLFEYRQLGVYGDFAVTEGLILPLLKDVDEFQITVFNLLQEAGYKINNEL